MLILTYIMEQIGKCKQLLDTARECFNFVTNFFEVINVSAIHIYHSALELSPLTSIVRKLYYHHRIVPLPRLVTGTPDIWDESITIYNKDHDYKSHAWSQCGQFVAAQKRDTVEIRDPLTLELLSTLKSPRPTPSNIGLLAYSPDGYSLACLSKTVIMIWDIQTCEVTKEIEYDNSGLGLLAWSLDGKTIATLSSNWRTGAWVACIHDIASGKTLSPTTLWPTEMPYIWGHNTSFQIAMMVQQIGAWTIEIYDYEVGCPHAKAKSFHIPLWGSHPEIGSFSPTAHRISISASCQLAIMDIQNSKFMLQERSTSRSHQCFSADGSLFATSLHMSDIHVWKYTSGCYILLKNVSCWRPHNFQFSPTSSSILGRFGKLLKVWRLDGLPTKPKSDIHTEQFIGLSHNNTCMATVVQHPEGTIAITNFLSQTPSQFIDTGMKITGLALTGNILLVEASKTVVVAWLLTEKGVVVDISGNQRADHSNGIWKISVPEYGPHCVEFSAKTQTGVIVSQERTPCSYHLKTGQALDYSQQPGDEQKCNVNMNEGSGYHLHQGSVDNSVTPHEDSWLVSQDMLQEGWVKDPEGKHQFWIPVEWRVSFGGESWCHDVKTLYFKITGGKVIVIKF